VRAFPDYAVSKSNDITMASPTDQITYQISATNTGTQFGTNVVITDTYLSNILDVVDADGGVVDVANGTITWTLPLFEVGHVEDIQVIMEVRPNAFLTSADQLFTNNVSITDDGNNGEDPDLANNSDSETDMLLANQGEPLILAATPIDAPATALSDSDSIRERTAIANSGAQRGLDATPRYVSSQTMNGESNGETDTALERIEDNVIQGGDLLDDFMFDVNLCNLSSEGTACATIDPTD